MAQREDGLDLGYLGDESKEKTPPRSGEIVSEGSIGKDFYDTPSSQGGTSVSAMARTIATMSSQPVPQLTEVEMSTVDVKCNYAKDRVEVFWDLIMKFNQDGICKMPTHQMPLLAAIQRARPGRFTVVVAPVAAAPAPAPVALVVDAPVKPVEVVVAAPKKAAKKNESAQKAPKKKRGAVVRQPDAADKFFADKENKS